MIVWKPVLDAPGYEVSSTGLVRSVDRISVDKNGKSRSLKGQLLTLVQRPDGYLTVKLGKYRSNDLVHRLVAQVFLGPVPNNMEVCHNDGEKWNNSIENLRYDSRKGNIGDTLIHNTHANANKSICPRGHKLEHPNLNPYQLNKNGGRYCLACTKASKYNRRGRRLTVEEYQELSDKFYLDLKLNTC